jgi:hypothetical protein
MNNRIYFSKQNTLSTNAYTYKCIADNIDIKKNIKEIDILNIGILLKVYFF